MLLKRFFLWFYFHRSFICCQNKTIQHIWLQPLQWRCMWQPSSAPSGWHWGDGFCCVWHPGSEPNRTQGQPCYWRYGELLSAYLNNHIWSKAEPDLKMIFSCRWRGVKLSPKGSIILDPDFDIVQEMGHLCKMCKAISANRQLVKPGGAQCLPSGNFYFKQ